MRMDALQAIKQLGDSATDVGADDSSLDSNEIEKRTKAYTVLLVTSETILLLNVSMHLPNSEWMLTPRRNGHH